MVGVRAGPPRKPGNRPGDAGHRIRSAARRPLRSGRALTRGRGAAGARGSRGRPGARPAGRGCRRAPGDGPVRPGGGGGRRWRRPGLPVALACPAVRACWPPAARSRGRAGWPTAPRRPGRPAGRGGSCSSGSSERIANTRIAAAASMPSSGHTWKLTPMLSIQANSVSTNPRPARPTVTQPRGKPSRRSSEGRQQRPDGRQQEQQEGRADRAVVEAAQAVAEEVVAVAPPGEEARGRRRAGCRRR